MTRMLPGVYHGRRFECDADTQGKTGDVSVTPFSAPAVEILRNRLDVAGIVAPRAKPARAKR